MSTSAVMPDEEIFVVGTSWRPIATTICSLLGLGVSIYLTIAHYSTAVQLACPATTTINCEKVTTSPESYAFHIPVAVLGLAFFVPMLLLSLPVAWRSPLRFVAPLRLAMSVIGVGFVIYLVHAELFDIHAICLWCTSVHVLTFIVFVAVITGWDEARAASDPPYLDESEVD